MSKSNFLNDSKAFVSSWLRSIDITRAGGDVEKLKEIGERSDDETLRKWLWTVVVIGAPACFIAVPLFLSVLALLFSTFIMQALWFIAKLAMSCVMLIFAIAVYLTWRKNAE